MALHDIPLPESQLLLMAGSQARELAHDLEEDLGPWTPAERQRAREYFTEGIADLLEDWTPPGASGAIDG